MLLEFLSVGLLGILILGIVAPYWLKTKDLKKISSKDLPSDGHWAQLSKGNIYYRWHHPEQKNGQTNKKRNPQNTRQHQSKITTKTILPTLYRQTNCHANVFCVCAHSKT